MLLLCWGRHEKGFWLSLGPRGCVWTFVSGAETVTVVPRVQVSLVGDFDPKVAEQAFLEFMGTIPAREEPLPLPHVPITFNTALPVGDRHVVRLHPPFPTGPGGCTGSPRSAPHVNPHVTRHTSLPSLAWRHQGVLTEPLCVVLTVIESLRRKGMPSLHLRAFAHTQAPKEAENMSTFFGLNA